ncbi:MAG: BrnA antitoxin family protein [Desulfuromonadales bacterium]|nr:BrnA antitoxin family protein [Desulfuromonadales bacterium]
MKGKHTSTSSRTDLERVTKMKDEEIDYSDIPPLRDDFFKEAHIRWPEKKKQVTLRIDPDVIEFFKMQGKGYQSMINAVLRKYVEAHNH